ncbi:MAG TPA: trypsin-like peptidase domain-containing protein [Streptosporangiaceae bacterium]|jgi:serine protease Do|nr:trypsin-like peptidase domain-containing protein [Streptosporangiaceae bacterium]
MAVLEEIQQNIARLTESAGASVVGIGQRWGVGSGVILGDGRVLTNAHNVRGDQVSVTFPDGRTAEGTVAGRDLDGDLAVIDVDTSGAPALSWAANASVGVGTPVFALSNPGGRGLRVTVGFVSGVERSFRGPRGRRITGSVEHTAPLLPGSSGGPVVDADGQLLGVNTNRLGEGFYLAIPADESLRSRVDGLSRGESAQRPQLGIAIAPRHVASRLRRAVGLPDIEGLLIQDVTEGSPAARAGLAQGDLIVAAGTRPVRSMDDLFDVLASAGSDSLELRVVRGVDERTIQVAFEEGERH